MEISKIVFIFASLNKKTRENMYRIKNKKEAELMGVGLINEFTLAVNDEKIPDGKSYHDYIRGLIKLGVIEEY